MSAQPHPEDSTRKLEALHVTRTTIDQEIDLIGLIIERLPKLNPEARARVLHYAQSIDRDMRNAVIAAEKNKQP